MLQERKIFAIEMILQQFQEGLLIFVPPETILRVANLKPFEMKLAKKTQRAKTSRLAKDERGAITFVATALDEAAAAEKGKTGPREVAWITQGGEARYLEPVTEVKGDVFPPEARLTPASRV